MVGTVAAERDAGGVGLCSRVTPGGPRRPRVMGRAWTLFVVRAHDSIAA